MCSFFYRKGFDTDGGADRVGDLHGACAAVSADRSRTVQQLTLRSIRSDCPDVGTRLEEASVAWYQLSQRYGLPGKTEANLHPYTATLESLPANLPAPIYLPKVGLETNPTEEETRESLRRFIVEWQRLIGAEPNQLSLVERIDEAIGCQSGSLRTTTVSLSIAWRFWHARDSLSQ